VKSNEERLIDQFRRRLAGFLILKHALTALTIWAFLAGVAVLALRSLGVSALTLLWGLLSTLPLALVPAVLLACRRLPSRAAVRAVLDRHSHCGGLLMADAEVALGDWQRSLPTIELPRLQWRSSRAWGLLAGGVAFVLLGLLLPQGFAEMGSDPGLNIEKQKAKLEKQIDVLKQETFLEPRKADDLKAKLDQLRREALGKEPVKTLDALDHLKDMVTTTAKEAAESTARKKETLGQAETLADRLMKKRPKDKEMSAKAMAEAMKQLATLTRKAAEENAAFQKKLDELDKELADALKGGTLTPEQLEKLKELLKDAKGDLSEKLARLRKEDLIDAELGDLCDKAGDCDCAGLAAYLKEHGASKELCDTILLEGEPGRGGVNRGPGAAAMLWKDPTTDDGFTFKEEALPPAQLQALKDSKLKGVSAGVPQKGGETGPAESGALAGSTAGGGSASTPVILPRHRGAVERYFERPGK
jgi:hypothetical protein